MSKPPKALIAEWYAKAKKSGFTDIESANGTLRDADSNNTPLINDNYTIAGARPYLSSLVDKLSRAEYYRLAGQYLYDKKFKSSKHKKVWALHAEGHTIEEVSQILDMPKNTVNYWIVQMRQRFYSTK